MSVLYVKSDGTLATQLSVGADDVLDVNVVGAVIPPPVGGATEAEQQTQTALLTSIDGNIVACNTGAVTISSSALPAGAATETTLNSLNGKVTACNTGAVTISSSALPAGAATNLAVAQPTTSVAITPSDSTDLTATVTKGLWVGVAGNLSVKLSADSVAVTIANVPSGTYVPGAFSRVMAASTATSIVGFGG